MPYTRDYRTTITCHKYHIILTYVTLSFMLLWLLFISGQWRNILFHCGCKAVINICGKAPPRPKRPWLLCCLLYFMQLTTTLIYVCIMLVPRVCNKSGFMISSGRKLSKQTTSLLGQCTTSCTPLAILLSWCGSFNSAHLSIEIKAICQILCMV